MQECGLDIGFPLSVPADSCVPAMETAGLGPDLPVWLGSAEITRAS